MGGTEPGKELFESVWGQDIVKVKLVEMLLLSGAMSESPNYTDLAFPEVDTHVLTQRRLIASRHYSCL